jgi:AraC-like DNA-binding protein
MNRELREITDWVGMARAAKYQPQNLARLCHCSLRQLELHFDRCCMMPPEIWLLEVKLWESVRFMIEGQDVKVASQNAGFKDICHFYRRFKEYHGCTPLELLETHRRRRLDTEHTPGQLSSELALDPSVNFDCSNHTTALKTLNQRPVWRPRAMTASLSDSSLDRQSRLDPRRTAAPG